MHYCLQIIYIVVWIKRHTFVPIHIDVFKICIGTLCIFKILPRLSTGNFGERVNDVGRCHLKSRYTQIVNDSVAFETATRVPQNVIKWVLQYEFMAQSFDVFPVDRIRCAWCTMIDFYALRPAESQKHWLSICVYYINTLI